MLRDEIVTAEIEPEAPIKQGHIAARFGVSQAPVREALNQLIAEHLVVHYPNRGVRVAPLDIAELREAAGLRIGLESDLVRAAASNFTDEDAARAQAVLEGIKSPPSVGALMRAHDAFHDALYEPACAPIALDMVRQLRSRCSRYLGYMWKHSDQAPLSFAEHWELFALVRQGRGDDAAAFLRPHIEGSTAAVAAVLARG